MAGAMQRGLFAVFIVTVGLVGNISHAGLINGDFSSGLDGWDHSDDMAVVGGRAQFNENSGMDWLLLRQELSVVPGTYDLSFDLTFVSEGDGGGETDTLSVALVDGSDTVVASLYGLDNAGGDPGIDVPLLVHRSVTLSAPTPDPLWLRFQADFDFFDDLTTVISVDNVTFTPSTPVPVPGAMSLLFAGLASLSIRHLRRSPGPTRRATRLLRGSCVPARPWTSGDARPTRRLESLTEHQPYPARLNPGDGV